MLEERAEAGTGEAMTQELGLGNPELTFAQANGQAMDSNIPKGVTIAVLGTSSEPIGI